MERECDDVSAGRSRICGGESGKRGVDHDERGEDRQQGVLGRTRCQVRLLSGVRNTLAVVVSSEREMRSAHCGRCPIGSGGSLRVVLNKPSFSGFYVVVASLFFLDQVCRL